MRISPSVLRNAATNPTFRLAPVVPGSRTGGPSTDGALRTAIRMFHEAGLDEAREALTTSLTSGYWGTGPGLTMRTSAQACLETYARLAAADGPQVFAGSSRTWQFDETTDFSINPHVVLFDEHGYVPRICLPGPLPHRLTPQERVLIASPTILGMAEELDGGHGGQTVIAAQVWELRSGHTGEVSRGEATAARPGLEALLRRIGALPA